MTNNKFNPDKCFRCKKSIAYPRERWGVVLEKIEPFAVCTACCIALENDYKKRKNTYRERARLEHIIWARKYLGLKSKAVSSLSKEGEK